MSITDSLKFSNKLYDLLIIGAGPAGMTAAIYASRANIKTAFIEYNAPGGKMVKTSIIENYPGFENINGADLSLKMMNQALANNVTYLYGKVVKVEQLKPYWKINTEDQQTYYAKTVLIATGTVENKLNIPNELEYYGNGVSYCAVCDGALYKGQDVIVIGGGNSAVEEAVYLSSIVKKVHVVHRRNEFRAVPRAVEVMKETKNIEIHTPAIPLRVVVENDKVVGLEIEDVNTKERKILSGACVFPYIGLSPVTDFLTDLDVVDPKTKFIIADQNMKTNLPGLFAAGDIVNKSLRQITTAVSDGAVAAVSVANYLSQEFNEE